jgi:hypothetical protein
MALYTHECKNFHWNTRWTNKMNKREKKKNIQSDQPAWKPGGASATL